MKSKTSSIGINFSGYPASASNFIVDNGCLTLIDVLVKDGHSTTLFDYNNPETVDYLKTPLEIQHSLENIIIKINAETQRLDPGLLREFNEIEKEIETIRESKVKKMAVPIVEYCQTNQIDFVWMKLWTGEGFRSSIILADEIKRAIPGIKIIGGGHHIRLFREKSYEFADSFDALAYSEGETTLPKLADWVAGNLPLDSIPGILFKEGSEIIDTKGKIFSTKDELNQMVVPNDFYGFYGPRYKSLDDKIIIGLPETSRGCPEAHVFCQHPINAGDCWRLIDPEVVVGNIQKYFDNQIYAFRIPDSNPPKKHLMRIYHDMKKMQLRANSITAFCEVPEFDSEFGKLFREIGGYCLFFGIESGSEQILKNIGKHYGPEQAAKTISIAKELGINIVTSFMVPTIGDTEATITETEDWIRRVQPHYWPIGPTVPMGRMLLEPERYGYELGADFFKKFQFYSAKLHIPPQFGGTLPVKKDGKDWNHLKAISGNLMNKLRGVGKPLISDEIVMLAHLANEEPAHFNTKFTDCLRRGETEIIRDYIRTINTNIGNPIYT
jgi:hypothetical protein